MRDVAPSGGVRPVSVTVHGDVVFVLNAGNDSHGSLNLLAAVAATTGAGPTDLARSEDGAYLYVRVRSGAVGAFAIGGDGSLTPRGEFTGSPSIGTSGLAAD